MNRKLSVFFSLLVLCSAPCITLAAPLANVDSGVQLRQMQEQIERERIEQQMQEQREKKRTLRIASRSLPDRLARYSLF